MQKIFKLFNQYKGLPKEIYIIFISRIINSMGSFVQPLLALILTDKIGLGTDAAGLYITILSILSIPSLILGGKLVDSIGRKKIIIVSQSFGALALILCGLMKPNMYMVCMLMASSLLYAISSPAYDAILGDLTNPQNRKASYSMVYMGWNLGFSIGPLVGGLLYKQFLPLVFIGDGITTILSLILVTHYIGETKNLKQDMKSSRKMEKDVEGSVFKVLLQRPVLIYFSLIVLCYEFEYSQWGFTLPIQLKNIFQHNGATYYGMISSFNGIVVILFTPLISKLTHNIKPISVMALGGICYAVSFGMLSFINILPLFFVSIFIMTIGEIMTSINSSTFTTNLTPASHRGRVSSIIPMIIGTGYTLGPLVMGKYIAIYNISSAWIVIGSLGIISTLLMIMLGRSKAVQNS